MIFVVKIKRFFLLWRIIVFRLIRETIPELLFTVNALRIIGDKLKRPSSNFNRNTVVKLND